MWSDTYKLATLYNLCYHFNLDMEYITWGDIEDYCEWKQIDENLELELLTYMYEYHDQLGRDANTIEHTMARMLICEQYELAIKQLVRAMIDNDSSLLND